ncbi:ATP-binding protein [Spiractinospora alimapuensis]|uniref:ATP-binding protein n=1 Tax=Spiractinospora alimapuensis TaxID=2820884 RepID=UPI001F3934DF|nr:ATP-binding protein [Spiractinospora alimapuensis]QVQ53369.1 ATP-binding protein [Spiractinospora alimapuensis]
MKIRERQFPGTADSIPQTRECLRQFLAPTRVPLVLQQDAEVILSELATNAVRHSRSGVKGGRYTVVLRLGATHLIVAVTDAGATSIPHPRRPLSLEPGGRGLTIVQALASNWWTSTTQSRCTVVAEFALRGTQ